MQADAEQIFLDALKESTPSSLIEDFLALEGEKLTINSDHWEIDDPDLLYVAAVGKAALPMAKALEKQMEVWESNMICITPDPQPDVPYAISSSHPVPDEKSRNAADSLIRFIDAIPPNATVLFAISGGTSSLLCKPGGELRLQELNTMNKLLLESGANIEEINSVRKHLSAIKGGQLLSHFNPDATLIDLVISDVPSDDLAIIGSGPTTPDASTFRDAHDTLFKYGLWEKVPEPVRMHIVKGLNGDVAETIKPGKDPLRNHHSYIIGSARKFAQKMATVAEQQGYLVWMAGEAYNQPAKAVADMVNEKVRERMGSPDPPLALIFYGESTVNVTGGGKGGRNQEMALRGALHIQDLSGVTWLSAGTDGVDGPTDAAGAIVDGNTIERAEQMGLDASKFLADNDSYHFHEKLGTLLKTGPTGNNVMDVVVVFI